MYIINSNLILNKLSKLGYNQKEFSKSIGVSQPTFSRILSGESKVINLEVLYKISKILDLKLDEVIIDNTDDINMISKKDLIFDLEIITKHLLKSLAILKEYNQDNMQIFQDSAEGLLLLDNQINKTIDFEITTKKIIKEHALNKLLEKNNSLIMLKNMVEHYEEIAITTDKDEFANIIESLFIDSISTFGKTKESEIWSYINSCQDNNYLSEEKIGGIIEKMFNL